MVSARRGYAVIGRAVVGTTDGEHWTTLFRAPQDLSYVDAVDENHVWAVGTRSVFVSADGGRSWSARSSGQQSVGMVHFVGGNHGWAVVNTSLARTDNGGRSWTVQTAPCPVDRVCFADAQHGWLATHDSAYRTTDGGAHWQRALAATDASTAVGVAADVQCASDNSAWILFDGLNGATGHLAYVGYRCPPTGTCAAVVKENFFPPIIPSIDGPGSYPGPFSVVDEHTAVFVGNTPPVAQPLSMLLLTDDGKTRGPLVAIPENATRGASALSASFVSARRGWIVDSVGLEEFHILATADGGKTWTQQYRAPQ